MIGSYRSTHAQMNSFILSVPLVQKSSSSGTESSDEFIVVSLLCSVRLILNDCLTTKHSLLSMFDFYSSFRICGL